MEDPSAIVGWIADATGLPRRSRLRKTLVQRARARGGVPNQFMTIGFAGVHGSGMSTLASALLQVKAQDHSAPKSMSTKSGLLPSWLAVPPRPTWLEYTEIVDIPGYGRRDTTADTSSLLPYDAIALVIHPSHEGRSAEQECIESVRAQVIVSNKPIFLVLNGIDLRQRRNALPLEAELERQKTRLRDCFELQVASSTATSARLAHLASRIDSAGSLHGFSEELDAALPASDHSHGDAKAVVRMLLERSQIEETVRVFDDFCRRYLLPIWARRCLNSLFVLSEKKSKS